MMYTSRRKFLGGAAVRLALPPLLSLLSKEARAAAANEKPIQRFVVMFAPNGRYMPMFQPTAFGRNVALPRALAPLQPFQQRLLVVSNLRNDAAGRRGAGTGAHARAASSVLTGSSIETASRVGLSVSMDQLLQQTVPQSTAFPSLQWAAAVPGACDGANCLYNQTISWRDATTPLSPMCNPKSAFEQLFAGQDSQLTQSERALRQARQSSILDYVTQEARSLQHQLSRSDVTALDAYLTGVRELEQQIQQVRPACDAGKAPGPVTDYAHHVALFNQLMVLALQCDLTRIITFMFEYDVTHRTHPFLNSFTSYHSLSHYGNQDDLEQLIRIETWQSQQVAHLARLLQAQQVGGTSLLDSTVLYYLPSMGNGAIHDYTKMTVALLTGNTSLHSNMHIDGQGELLANCNLAILRALGSNATKLGEDGQQAMRNLLI